MNKAKFIAPLPSRKHLEKELDKACSLLCKKGRVCIRCGAKENIEDAHIISRQNHAVRWDIENRLPLCNDCHCWAHANPIFFEEFVKNTLGELKYEALKQRSLAIRMWKREEMHSYLVVLKRQLGLRFSQRKTMEV